MQAMRERDQRCRLEGTVHVDDAYLGGENPGGKPTGFWTQRVPHIQAVEDLAPDALVQPPSGLNSACTVERLPSCTRPGRSRQYEAGNLSFDCWGELQHSSSSFLLSGPRYRGRASPPLHSVRSLWPGFRSLRRNDACSFRFLYNVQSPSGPLASSNRVHGR